MVEKTLKTGWIGLTVDVLLRVWVKKKIQSKMMFWLLNFIMFSVRLGLLCIIIFAEREKFVMKLKMVVVKRCMGSNFFYFSTNFTIERFLNSRANIRWKSSQDLKICVRSLKCFFSIFCVEMSLFLDMIIICFIHKRKQKNMPIECKCMT